MTTEDQIRDEKLQYNINREAAKISPLLSNKFDKNEYLTCEEILPSNQKQMIEQAKFTYSPLGKAFEEQIKTIEEQREKHIKPIQNQGQVKTTKKYSYDDEDSPLISKEKEIFNKLVDKKLDEMTKLDKEISNNDLIYKTPDENFNTYNALDLIDKIKNGKINLADVKNDQTKFKSYLGEIRKGKNKSKGQKKTKNKKNKKKTRYTILKCFTKQETRILKFMMIIR